MIDDALLATLRCPKDHSTMHRAEAEIVAQVNAAIRGGSIRNQAGKRIDLQIGGGLIRAGGDLLYPIVDQIPVMLYDEAIPLHQISEIE